MVLRQIIGHVASRTVPPHVRSVYTISFSAFVAHVNDTIRFGQNWADVVAGDRGGRSSSNMRRPWLVARSLAGHPMGQWVRAVTRRRTGGASGRLDRSG